MKYVYIPYDGMQMYYLDAYLTWDKAQDALEDNVKNCSDWEEDEWKYYLSDECSILKFRVVV